MHHNSVTLRLYAHILGKLLLAHIERYFAFWTFTRGILRRFADVLVMFDALGSKKCAPDQFVTPKTLPNYAQPSPSAPQHALAERCCVTTLFRSRRGRVVANPNTEACNFGLHAQRLRAARGDPLDALCAAVMTAHTRPFAA